GRRARRAVENEAGLPSLQSARHPSGRVPQKELVGSDGKFDRAVHADAVRPFLSSGKIKISVGWIGECGWARDQTEGREQLHRLGPDVCGLDVDSGGRPDGELRLK